jgi:hypothetical protein
MYTFIYYILITFIYIKKKYNTVYYVVIITLICFFTQVLFIIKYTPIKTKIQWIVLTVNSKNVWIFIIILQVPVFMLAIIYKLITITFIKVKYNYTFIIQGTFF